jgi:ubiquinone/menaquinone biosynthesis C-methylase UbiE
MQDWKSRPAEFRRLWSYSVGFYGVWVGHIGRRMGLFERISKNSLSPDQLASATGLDRSAVRSWCSAAKSLGFVRQRGGKMTLTESMKEILLDQSSPQYLGGQFSYLAGRSLEYGGMDELFRSGRTLDMSSSFDAIEQATDWDHHAFLSAVKDNRHLHRRLSEGCQFLDVGCGTGTLIEKLCSAYPHSQFVGVEPSPVAVGKAVRLAAGKPVRILKQSGESMDFEKEFDMVYLGESLYAAADKQKVLSNCFGALKKTGTIAVVEGLLPDSDTVEDQLIMGMQIDFALQGYRFLTKKEIRALLLAAGFSKIKFQNFGGSLFLVTARK